jgi:hypothetical protein
MSVSGLNQLGRALSAIVCINVQGGGESAQENILGFHVPRGTETCGIK